MYSTCLVHCVFIQICYFFRGWSLLVICFITLRFLGLSTLITSPLFCLNFVMDQSNDHVSPSWWFLRGRLLLESLIYVYHGAIISLPRESFIWATAFQQFSVFWSLAVWCIQSAKCCLQSSDAVLFKHIFAINEQDFIDTKNYSRIFSESAVQTICKYS